ncbi:branched chain amino acid aminotransferase, partial [Candidatus Hydrogenedentota bacterium]
EVDARPVGRTEMYVADEMLYAGTGAQVAPVTQVDGRDIGDGSPGEITMKLQKLYFDIVHGRVEKYRDWLTPVY